MQRIVLIENGILNCIAIIFSYILSYPLASMVYKSSDMSAFGYRYQFSHVIFGLVVVGAFAINVLVTIGVLKEMKNSDIIQDIESIE